MYTVMYRTYEIAAYQSLASAQSRLRNMEPHMSTMVGFYILGPDGIRY